MVERTAKTRSRYAGCSRTQIHTLLACECRARTVRSADDIQWIVEAHRRNKISFTRETAWEYTAQAADERARLEWHEWIHRDLANLGASEDRERAATWIRKHGNLTLCITLGITFTRAEARKKIRSISQLRREQFRWAVHILRAVDDRAWLTQLRERAIREGATDIAEEAGKAIDHPLTRTERIATARACVARDQDHASREALHYIQCHGLVELASLGMRVGIRARCSFTEISKFAEALTYPIPDQYLVRWYRSWIRRDALWDQSLWLAEFRAVNDMLAQRSRNWHASIRTELIRARTHALKKCRTVAAHEFSVLLKKPLTEKELRMVHGSREFDPESMDGKLCLTLLSAHLAGRMGAPAPPQHSDTAPVPALA
ncbi:hypothetical protein HY632_01810 [Candidatus Uhrbacteria bacterium]|nr:hypothetical protein [Candidatus Uhrbacteria bacterium]